jgi:hypothetical protein
MSPKYMKGRKERLRPLSFYGHDPEDVIRAFMQIDSIELKKLKGQDQTNWNVKEHDGTEDT